MNNIGFKIIAKDQNSEARAGILYTPHGIVETPVFMPVGTCGAVKATSPQELLEIGAEIILANTYHLALRPGIKIIEKAGGLHSFMGWHGPILTDSGGYQIFSLANLRRISVEGVEFRSHIDGTLLHLSPREVMDIQYKLGSDIVMVLDHCPQYPAKEEDVKTAVINTLRWARTCKDQPLKKGSMIFGIVQGGEFEHLRRMCAMELVKIDFDGYAIGGICIGEPDELVIRQIAITTPYLPKEKPRYLMGVGRFDQIVEAVSMGIDMFDCVMPTRFARNGTAFTFKGRYPVKASSHKEDESPLEEKCGCYTCRNFSKAYVRHLINIDEILGIRLITIHNIYCYFYFMKSLRNAILTGKFMEFRENFFSNWKNILKEGENDDA